MRKYYTTDALSYNPESAILLSEEQSYGKHGINIQHIGLINIDGDGMNEEGETVIYYFSLMKPFENYTKEYDNCLKILNDLKNDNDNL